MPDQDYSFYKLKAKIEEWADDRYILQNSTGLGQAKKTLEEAGELIEAATMIQNTNTYIKSYKDAIGDTLVTLIIGCACEGVDIIECLALAYNEIKDRTGHLREDGVFVKDVEPIDYVPPNPTSNIKDWYSNG